MATQISRHHQIRGLAMKTTRQAHQRPATIKMLIRHIISHHLIIDI
jgi:hypothetical protein